MSLCPSWSWLVRMMTFRENGMLRKAKRLQDISRIGFMTTIALVKTKRLQDISRVVGWGSRDFAARGLRVAGGRSGASSLVRMLSYSLYSPGRSSLLHIIIITIFMTSHHHQHHHHNHTSHSGMILHDTVPVLMTPQLQPV